MKLIKTRLFLDITPEGVYAVKETYGKDKDGKLLKNAIRPEMVLYSDDFTGDTSDFYDAETGKPKYKDFKNGNLVAKSEGEIKDREYKMMKRRQAYKARGLDDKFFDLMEKIIKKKPDVFGEDMKDWLDAKKAVKDEIPLNE